jgi:ATPase related to the helicase subunit of the Holliday junction resolvase
MNKPAADKIRPVSFDEMAGQRHLTGEKGILRRMIQSGRITNMVFYGPPGTGKTTAANIIAASSDMYLEKLNATTATLADIKNVASKTTGIFGTGGILLYLDEIQYFNKKQQQSLLEYIEDGRITLIASTTENPYYYIYDALLSRCSVFEFKPVTADEMMPVLRRALNSLCDEASETRTSSDEILKRIASYGGGDVRRAVTILEGIIQITDSGAEITIADVDSYVPSAMAGVFDRDGDVHYDLLSALQKSIRGSDPDAAIFYLAKLLEGGDLISPCRRLQVIANEDIGLAYPMAAVITHACVESARQLGLPEAQMPLSNATIMLATAPKSNAAISALTAAAADIKAGMGTEVPEHLRSPLFKGYKYAHDYEDNYVPQQYLPNDVKDRKYYRPGKNKTEEAARLYWEKIKTERGRK